MVFAVLCLLCLCARLFICALWSHARKGLTSWLSFVVSYCEFTTFPLVSLVRCGTRLYRLLIFAPLLSLFKPLQIRLLPMLWLFEKKIYINTLQQELSTAKTYEHNRFDETSIVDRQRCHMAAKFGLFVDEDHSQLPTLYWLPKLHKRPY